MRWAFGATIQLTGTRRAALRKNCDKARKLIDERFAADAERAGLLNRLLDKAEDLTMMRGGAVERCQKGLQRARGHPVPVRPSLILSCCDYYALVSSLSFVRSRNTSNSVLDNGITGPLPGNVSRQLRTTSVGPIGPKTVSIVRVLMTMRRLPSSSIVEISSSISLIVVGPMTVYA